jgi:alpha-tubulin suppressor-like RCC1 family protein
LKYGQTGQGQSDTTIVFPKFLMDNVTEVSTYYYHSIVVQNYTTLWTFGYNQYGQIGDGTINHKYVPTNVTFSEERIRQVSCGKLHSVVLFEGGSMWAFGKFSFFNF